jgi:hypothetical protein
MKSLLFKGSFSNNVSQRNTKQISIKIYKLCGPNGYKYESVVRQRQETGNWYNDRYRNNCDRNH